MLQKHSLVILFLHRKMMFFFFLVPLNLVLGDQFISFRGDKPNRSLRQCSDPGVNSCERVTSNLQRQLSFVHKSDDKIDNLWGGAHSTIHSDLAGHPGFESCVPWLIDSATSQRRVNSRGLITFIEPISYSGQWQVGTTKKMTTSDPFYKSQNNSGLIR